MSSSNADLLRKIFAVQPPPAQSERPISQHFKLVENMAEGSVFIFHGSASEPLAQILAAKNERSKGKRASNSPPPPPPPITPETGVSRLNSAS